jgi:hypothetical protein
MEQIKAAVGEHQTPPRTGEFFPDLGQLSEGFDFF